jgi:hypothetical protein
VNLRSLPARLPGTALSPALLLAAAALAAGGEVPGGDGWKYDVVYRKKGSPFQGLVVEQTPEVVRLRCVSRRPGSPTVVYPVDLPAADVERVELAPDDERDRLRARLEALRRERRTLAERLQALDLAGKSPDPSEDALELRPVPWVGDSRAAALEFRSPHFRLVSNARRGVVELAAIHLEQVYAAYARTLPPRAPGTPTLIILAGSLADYQRLLEGRGLNLTNPAFYDTERNQVVCFSDLERLADELERARQYHARQRAEINEREADLKAAYKGAIPPEVRAQLDQARRRLEAAETSNAAAFARARERLFQRLYHEAFHAYVATFVYPPAEGGLPRWLNEGLAQVFETAIVEVGELRVGHADPERRTAVRKALAGRTLLPLADLLRADHRAFRVAHGGDQQASDRHYLAAWALAFYLTFDQKVLGTRALDDYVRALHRGADPVAAFAGLVGRPLPAFEKDFHDYLRHLRADGGARVRSP